MLTNVVNKKENVSVTIRNLYSLSQKKVSCHFCRQRQNQKRLLSLNLDKFKPLLTGQKYALKTLDPYISVSQWSSKVTPTFRNNNQLWLQEDSNLKDKWRQN